MTSELHNSSLIEIQSLKENLDEAFLFLNAVTICLMQLGFACVEMGSVRKKNIISVLMKNSLDMFICTVTYWLVGYSLAYGTGSPFLGLSLWNVNSLPHASRIHWFFQLSFAATASTIVSGAVAERCTLTAYIIYTIFISGFIYPMVSHWAWTDDGWLQKLGYKDLAGGGVVHLLGGMCALIGAVVLGSRLGRFQKPQMTMQNGNTLSSTEIKEAMHMPCSLICPLSPMPGHSSVLVGTGGLLLAITFIAFNGASIGQITGRPGQDPATAAIVAVNTILGGSGAILFALISLKFHKYLYRTCRAPECDLGITINAVLTGMVSLCAGADVLTQWGSMLTGFMGGISYFCTRYLMLHLRIDDPADVVSIHFGGGILGLLTRPIFAFPDGILFDHTITSAEGFLYNMLGAAVIACWCSSISFLIFSSMKKCGVLRVSPDDELKGLDIHYSMKMNPIDDIALQTASNDRIIIERF